MRARYKTVVPSDLVETRSVLLYDVYHLYYASRLNNFHVLLPHLAGRK